MNIPVPFLFFGFLKDRAHDDYGGQDNHYSADVVGNRHINVLHRLSSINKE
jgi:hypothetical protein